MANRDIKTLDAQDLIVPDETVTVHKFSCCLCGKEYEIEGDSTPLELHKQMHAKGWRNAESEVYQIMGLFCPECYKHREDPNY